MTAAGGLPLIVGARLPEPAGGGCVVPELSSTKPLSPEPEHPANITIAKPVINATLPESPHLFCILYLSMNPSGIRNLVRIAQSQGERGILMRAVRGIGAAGEIVDRLRLTADSLAAPLS